MIWENSAKKIKWFINYIFELFSSRKMKALKKSSRVKGVLPG